MTPASNRARARHRQQPAAMARDGGAPVVLTAGETAMVREVLVACSQTLTWAARHGSLQLGTIVAEATEAAGLGRSPGSLLYHINLAIDYLDFAPAARRRR